MMSKNLEIHFFCFSKYYKNPRNDKGIFFNFKNHKGNFVNTSYLIGISVIYPIGYEKKNSSITGLGSIIENWARN